MPVPAAERGIPHRWPPRSSANVLTWNSWPFLPVGVHRGAQCKHRVDAILQNLDAEVRRRTSAEITCSATTVFSSLMRTETGSFAINREERDAAWRNNSGAIALAG